MVAIVSGNGVGLLNSSASVLGQDGVFGSADTGSSKEGVYVNVANGNLTLQDKDDYLASSGIDLALTRTYNSQGATSDGIGAQWKLGVRKQIGNVTGTVNSAGSTLTRTDGDGTVQRYVYDSARAAYVSTDGAGAYQSIVRDGSGNWVWRADRSDLNGITEFYDGASGRITAVKDEVGTRLTYQYGATGQLTQITDATGDVTYFDFQNGNLTQIRTMVAGSPSPFVRTSYTYDGQGRLNTATVDLTPDNKSDTTSYTTTYTYDGISNRIASLTQSDGTALSFSYVSTSAGYKVASVTDGLGRRTSYDYSVAGKTIVTDPMGNITAYSYDSSGQLTQINQTPVTGVSISTTYTYDIKGNVTKIVSPDGESNAWYDDYGNQVKFRDPSGRIIFRTFDTSSGKVLTETTQYDNLIKNGSFDTDLSGWTYDAGSNWSSGGLQLVGGCTIYQKFTTEVGKTYKVSISSYFANADEDYQPYNYLYIGTSPGAYDVSYEGVGAGDGWLIFTATSSTTYLSIRSQAQVWDVSTIDNVTVQLQGTATTRYVYDAMHRTRFVASAAGRVTEYRYNADGAVSAVIRYPQTFYDVLNLAPNTVLTETQLTNWVNNSKRGNVEQTSYSYDARGLLVKESTWASADSTGTPTGPSSDTRYVYDQAGQLITKIAPSGSQTTYAYDGLGRLSTTTDANKNVTINTYDDAHHAISTTLANGLTTTSIFDSAGQLIATTRTALGTSFGTTRYAYDPDGRVYMKTDPDGTRNFMLYDAIGRRIAEIDGTGAVIEYSYDAANNLTRTLRYATRIDTATLFDANGTYLFKPLSDVRPNTNTDDRGSWNVYDKLNRLVDSVDGEGNVTHREYDLLSNVVVLTQRAIAIDVRTLGPTPSTLTLPPTSADDRITRSLYNNDNDLQFTVDPESFMTARYYDWSGRLTTFNQVQMVKPAGTYIGSQPGVTPSDIVIHYVYNNRGQLVGTVDRNGYLTENRYSAAGNLVSTITYGTPLSISTQFSTFDITIDALIPTSTSPDDRRVDYEYDALNRLTREVVAGSTETTYTYDNVGNLISRTVGSSGNQYRYDSLGRVTAELNPAGVAALATTDSATVWAQYATVYTYDAAGHRASMTDANGNRTLFYYDGDGRLLYTINALGEVSKQSYNAFGQVSQTTRFAKRLANGILTAMSGGISVIDTTIVDALAGTGDTVQTYSYDHDGHVTDQVDALGFHHLSKFNAFGEVTATFQPSVANSTAVNTATNGYSRVFYDRDGHVSVTVSGAGSVTAYQYDGSGHLVEKRTYANAIALATIATASKADVLASVVADAAHDVHQRFIYDGRGFLAATLTATNLDSAGTQQWSVNTRSYDASGNLAATTTFVNTLTKNAPTIADVGTVVVDNKDQMVRYVYDSANRLSATATAQRVGANGREWSITTQEYDNAGNVTAQTRLAALLTLADPKTADINGFASTNSSVNDQVTRYVYDAANRVIATAVAQDVENGALAWSVSTNTYDKVGNLIQKTQLASKLSSATLGSNKTPADYRAWILNGANAASPLDRSTRYGYDALNRLTTTIDAAGTVSQRVYDAKGNVVKSVSYATPDTGTGPIGTNYTPVANKDLDRVTRTVYNAANQAVYTVDALGGVTEYRYDARGNVIKTISYFTTLDPAKLPDLPGIGDVKPATSALDRMERRVYDQADRLRFSIDAAGYVSEIRYDGAGNVLRAIAWDANPTLAPGADETQTTTWTNALNGAANRATVNAYDAAGNLLNTTDAAGKLESYQYDGIGRRIKFTNKLGYTWSYQYDAAGRMVQEASPQVLSYANALYTAGTVWSDTHAQSNAPIVTKISYDAFGNVSTRTEAAGTAQERTTQYFYDAVGRQVKTVLPNVPVYDGTADPKSSAGAAARYEKDSGELSVIVTYNAFGDAVANKDVGGNVSEKAYDAEGRVAFERDAAGYVTEYQRDAFGNVTKLIRHATQYTDSMAVGLTKLSQNIVSDVSQDRSITTAYDLLGRVIKTTESQAYVYDPQVNLDGPVLAARTVVTDYDRFDDVIRSSIYGVTAAGAQVTRVATMRYYYDVRGLKTAELSVLRESSGSDAGLAYLTGFTYDAAGNLKTRTEYSAATSLYGDTRDTTDYKPLVSVPGADHKWAYEYDTLNRKVAETQVALTYTYSNGTTQQATTADVTTRYQYDALGNQIAVIDPLGGSVFTRYDALGRVTAIKKAQASGIAEVTSAGTPLTEFKLDVYGNVVLRIDYAQGAAVTSGSAVGTDFSALTPGDTNNREVATAYDKAGHAIQVVDGDVMSGSGAENRAVFTSYDAFGRAVKQWRSVTDSSGVQTAYSITNYDALGRIASVVTPANANLIDNTNTSGQYSLVTNSYNMFGELVQRSLTDASGTRTIERNSYDAAGNAWRSNSGDGVTKITLFDVQGNATSTLRSGIAGDTNPLDALTSVAGVFGINNLLRTDTTYDLLGHALSVSKVNDMTALRYVASGSSASTSAYGQWIETNDGFRPDDLLVVARPEDSAKTVTVNYRLAGDSAWTTASADRLQSLAGFRVFSTAGLQSGLYEFQVNMQGAGEAAYVSARGTVNVTSSSSDDKDLSVIRLYTVLFNRAPTQAELEAGVARLNDGAQLAQLARTLLDTDEARTHLGSDPLVAIQIILTNVFGHTGAFAGDTPDSTYQDLWSYRFSQTIDPPGDNRGSAIADLIEDVLTYPSASSSTSDDPDRIAARTRLRNRTEVLGAYLVDSRGANPATAASLLQAADAASASGAPIDSLIQDAVTASKQEMLHLQLAQLYVAAFGRAPDPKGMAFWLNAINNGMTTIEGAAVSLFMSDEAKLDPALYPPAGTTVAQSWQWFVNHTYQNMLGRLPSPDELSSWLNALIASNGAPALTMSQFVLQFTDSVSTYNGNDAARLQDKQLFNNRLAVGLAIANLKDGNGNPRDIDIGAARLVIGAVGGDATAMAASATAINALNGTANATGQVIAATSALASSSLVEAARYLVSKLYVALLGRAPDAVGMAFYAANPQTTPEGWASLADSLLTSAESKADGSLAAYKDVNGSLVQRTNEEFVQRVYELALGQSPLPTAGAVPTAIAAYVQRLNNGESRGAIAVAIANGLLNRLGLTAAEQALKDKFDNRAAVGVTFAIDLRSNDLQLARDTISKVSATDILSALDYAFTRSQATLAASLGANGPAASQASWAFDAQAAALAGQIAAQQSATAVTSALNSTSNAAGMLSLVQIYVGLLGRIPDATGLKFWFNGLNNGSITSLAQDMYQDSLVSSSTGRYPPTLTDEQFVAKVYASILGLDVNNPPPSSTWPGSAVHLQQLASGVPRGQVWLNILNGVLAYANGQPDAAAIQFMQYRAGLVQRISLALQSVTSAGDSELSVLMQDADQLHNQQIALQSALAVANNARDNAFSVANWKMYVGGSGPDGLGQYRMKVTMLYVMLLRRTTAPTLPELTQFSDASMSMDQVAQWMMTSAEAGTAYTNLDNNAFVKLLYERMLGRQMEPADGTFWLDALNSGTSRGTVVSGILESYLGYTENTSVRLANKASFDALIDGMLSTERDEAYAARESAGAAWDSANATATAAKSDYDSAVKFRDTTALAAKTAAVNAAADGHTLQTYSSLQFSTTYIYIGLRGYTDLPGLAWWMRASATNSGAQDSLTSALMPGFDNSHDFVASLYNTVLDRNGTDAEITWWADRIDNGTDTLLDVAKGFLYSPEANARLTSLTNSAMSADNDTAAMLIARESAITLAYDYAVTDASNKYAIWQHAVAAASVPRTAFTKAQNAYLSLFSLADAHPFVTMADSAYAAAQQAQDAYNAFPTQTATQDAQITALKSYVAADQAALNAANANTTLALAAVKAAMAVQSDNSLTTTARQVRQIAQYYTVLTGTAPTLSALKYWVDKLASGTRNVDIIDGIMNGPEATAARLYPSTLSNDAFVTQMYRLGLNRDMANDATGLRFWSDALSGSNPITRSQLVSDWIDALAETSNTTDTQAFDLRVAQNLNVIASASDTLSGATTMPAGLSLADYSAAYAALLGDASGRVNVESSQQAANVSRAIRLYMAIFDRSPDAGGLMFWVSAMTAQPALGDADFAASMLKSNDAEVLYPSSMAISGFATALTGRVLGRAPTSAELSSYATLSRSAIVAKILAAAADPAADLAQQGSTLLFNGKITAALAALQSDLPAYGALVGDAISLGNLAQSAMPVDRHMEHVVLGVNTALQGAKVGQVATTYTVDRWGNVLTMTDPRDANWVTTYTYNANNELTSTKTPFTLSNGTVSDYTITSTNYDRLGRMVSTTDARNNTNTYQYDSNGNVVTESHADGGVVKSAYSLFGQRLSVQQPGNGATPGVKTNYAYDHFGNLKSTSTDAAVDVYEIQNTGSNMAKYDYGYPNLDAVKVTTRQLVETYSYDELGRRITTRNAAGETTQTRYDVSGNVIAQQDALGNTTKTWYDALGHKLAQLDAIGTHKQTWDVDTNGRVTATTNYDYYAGSGWLSSLKTMYAYDNAGRLVRQTSSFNIGSKYALKQDTEQALTYVYDGQELRTINDQGTGQVSTYAYDRAGNRIRERITFAPTNANTPARTQNNTSTYDLQNRLASVQDDVYTITYSYDGNGNRTNTHTEFDLNGTRVKFDAYNTYDAMNRQLIVNGASTDGGKTVTMGTNGHVLTYDQAGNRLTDSYHGAKFSYSSTTASWTATTGASVVTVESYSYDGAGRLSGVTRDGLALGTRYYDAEGRVLESGVVPEAITTIGNSGALKSALAAAGLKAEYQVYLYDADGHVIRQVTRTIDKGWTADVYLNNDPRDSWQGYDADGNLMGYTAIDMTHGAKIQYRINYRFLNGGAQELSTTVTTETGGVNSTSSEYDANGNRNVIREANGSIRTRLWYDAAGHVMDKLEAGTTTFSLIVNDQVLGNEDKSATNVLGTTYTTLSASAPQDAPSVYVVQNTNETLQTVAKTLWGDQNLWYLIADANGLSLTTTLQVDQTLRIPARVSTVHNSADTFKPYNASEAIGDTAPLPVPSHSQGGCGTVGTVIAVVIAVYVTCVVGPAASSWLAGQSTVFGTAATATAAAVPNAVGLAVGGAIGGAAGSVASQAFSIATHAQEHFDWRSVAKSAVSGMVSGGLKGIDGFNELDAWQKGAITSAMTQGVSIVTGLQNGFSWRTVAASGIGAQVGTQVNIPGVNPFVNALASSFAAGVTTAALKGGKVAVKQVAADAFGNVLGNRLAESGQPDDPLGDFIQAHQKEWGAIPVANVTANTPEDYSGDLGGPDDDGGALSGAKNISRAVVGTMKEIGNLTPRDVFNYWTGSASDGGRSPTSATTSPDATATSDSDANKNALRASDRYYYSSVGNTADSSINDRIAYAYANAVLPNVDGLSDDQKGTLYGQMFLDANQIYEHNVLPQIRENAADAITAFNNRDAVIFGMRMATPLDANNGRGEFDDRVVAIQKQSDGSVSLLFEGAYTADPAGRYQQGNPYAGTHLEGTHANPDNPQELDIGRLRAGTYPYKFGRSDAGKGAPFFSDSDDNVLRPAQNVPTERYYNDRWNFDAESFTRDPVGSSFSGKNTVLFHVGYLSSASKLGYFTGSAACQTFPPTGSGAIQTFADKINLPQKTFYYTLTNMGTR